MSAMGITRGPSVTPPAAGAAAAAPVAGDEKKRPADETHGYERRHSKLMRIQLSPEEAAETLSPEEAAETLITMGNRIAERIIPEKDACGKPPEKAPFKGVAPLESDYISGYFEKLKEGVKIDPSIFDQWKQSVLALIDDTKEINAVFSREERVDAISKLLSQDAEIMVRKLRIESIIKVLMMSLRSVVLGGMFSMSGVISTLNDSIADAIASGRFPHSITDVLASLQSNRVADIALGGVMQSKYAELILGTINGAAIIRFAMHMNAELLEGELLEGEKGNPLNIISRLADSNLPIDEQVELIQIFVGTVLTDLLNNETVAHIARLAENFNPYGYILEQLKNKETRKRVKARFTRIAVEPVKELILAAATEARAEAQIEFAKEKLEIIQGPVQQVNPEGAMELPHVKVRPAEIGINIARGILDRTLSLITDISRSLFGITDPRPGGTLHSALYFIAAGINNTYESICPGGHQTAVKRAFVDLRKGEFAPDMDHFMKSSKGELLELEALEKLRKDTQRHPGDVDAQSKVPFADERQMRAASMGPEGSSSQDVGQTIIDMTGEPAAAAAARMGGARKRKHHSTRSSKGSKSSRRSTRKHGKPKSKRAKKSGAKTRHMRLAPGAGRRTRKHRK
jgi:hypothetical protein